MKGGAAWQDRQRPKSTISPTSPAAARPIAILEARWGNDGYAFWFKLLELLGDSNDFSFNCNQAADWEYLLSKTRVTEPMACAILDKLAEIEAIDADCWTEKIVWSDNFVKNLESVFVKRKQELPHKPGFPQPKREQNEDEMSFGGENSAEPDIIPTETDKAKESKPNQNKPKQNKLNQNTEEQTKPCAGATARGCESGSATEEPTDSNDIPPDTAEMTRTPEQPTLVLSELPPAKAKGKRQRLTVEPHPCPSSLRPGVVKQADTVYLTPEELTKLCREFGGNGAQRLLEILDAYKTNNPDKSAKYRDDFKVIHSWVIRRFREELDYPSQNKRAGPAPHRQKTFIDKLVDMAVEEEL